MLLHIVTQKPYVSTLLSSALALQCFREIRHYGFLSNALKMRLLKEVKKDLKRKCTLPLEVQNAKLKRNFGFSDKTYPCCGTGKMVAFGSWSSNKDPHDYLKMVIGS